VLAKHRIPAVLTMHDYKLICPAYTLYANGAPCERCTGGAYYNAALQGCVKGSRGKSALCTVEAYVHSALGLYRRHVARYVAPSRFLAAKAAEMGMDWSRITYIPNFVEPAAAPAASDGSYVLYAGRIEQVKGIRTLVEAFRQSAMGSSHELVIAGDGEDRRGIEDFALGLGADNVRFTGHLPQAELMPLIDGAAFTVAPSEWYENAPLSVMESAGRGKAVVVSDLGGLPELVRHGETGLVFKAGDATALASAIDELLGNPSRTREMGVKARAFISENYSAGRHYEELMGLYEQVRQPQTELVAAERKAAT
jgi:glycosyltransferase involved in cell wall biosynthesis